MTIDSTDPKLAAVILDQFFTDTGKYQPFQLLSMMYDNYLPDDVTVWELYEAWEPDFLAQHITEIIEAIDDYMR